MADSEIAIRLLEDVIIPACGVKKIGDIVTASDCGDSWEWMLARSRHKVVSPDDVSEEVPEVSYETPADASDDVQPDPGAESESEVSDETPADAVEVPETETDAVAKIKEVLGEKKSRVDDICEDTGLAEDVVVAALTEANGFQKNQQGWWKVVKS